MLDSLVRVSRRVGGAADLLATEMEAARENALAIRASLATRRRRSQEPGASPQGQNFTRALGPTDNGSSRERAEKCSRRRRKTKTRGPYGSDTPQLPRRQPEPRLATSRTPPFTTTQFHVLLNSLFKVLFNFPSRYLFAIGLGVIFSLTWSLPRTLSCTPKQLDSREKVGTATRSSYGPITLYGPWPQSRWTWTNHFAVRRLSQTLHSAQRQPSAVQCWALPVSFAITKGITVVFFSSAY